MTEPLRLDALDLPGPEAFLDVTCDTLVGP